MNHLYSALSSFPGRKVLVLGDVMLDRWVIGDVTRASPEADVLVLRKDRNAGYSRPGGAANVAANITSLGGKAYLFGAGIGKDSAGEELSKLILEAGIEFFPFYSGSTTEKTRFVGRRQQLLRVDDEDASQKNPSFPELAEYLQGVDAVALPDYAKGTINEELMQTIRASGKPAIVDPKAVNASLYKNVYLLKVNEADARIIANTHDVGAAGEYLRRNFNSNVIITQGKRGMSIFPHEGNPIHIPTEARGVYDVVGAGDVVTSVLAMARASGADLEHQAILANCAAGIKVDKFGTTTVSLRELEKRILREEGKIKTKEELESIVQKHRARKEKIVWTSGCFDILHPGHVRLFEAAREIGDVLIVGINSDESIKTLKGNGRPYMTQQERAEVLASLGSVDYVTIFPEKTPASVISALHPDIYAKGEDNSLQSIPEEERKAVESYGGEIHFIPIEKDVSISQIAARVRGS